MLQLFYSKTTTEYLLLSYEFSHFSQQITVSYAANLWWNWKLCIFIVLINFCHKVSLKRAWGTSSKSTNEAVILSWPTLFRNCALIFRKLVWKLKRERECVLSVDCGAFHFHFPPSHSAYYTLTNNHTNLTLSLSLSGQDFPSWSRPWKFIRRRFCWVC